jgi:hypothetical protein
VKPRPGIAFDTADGVASSDLRFGLGLTAGEQSDVEEDLRSP